MTSKEQKVGAIAKYSADELYKLVPSVYRHRDSEIGSPLFGFLSVIAEQVGILEDDIENLYENWFIETCTQWVVPYIGDLLGAKLLNSSGGSGVNRRSFVANTISYRRRKGTLLVLENLAKDITGWRAKAVEFFQLLGTTQCLNHIRPQNVQTPDIRKTEQLRLLNTPFDSASHTVEVRSIKTGKGFYNIPNIGIFLWRLEAFPVINSPAYKKENGFTFNVLGNDTQLFNNPVAESEAHQTAKETNLPLPITRLALNNHLNDYYSNFDADKSIRIKTDGVMRRSQEIIVCDLSNWTHPKNGIALDPVLGRVSFPIDQTPNDVHVDYYYGFSSKVGGGFYERPSSDLQKAQYFKIAEDDSIQKTAEAWNQEMYPEAIFEITDSEVYNEPINLSLSPNSKLEIRAAQRTRPLINAPVTITRYDSPISTSDSNSTQASVTFNGLLFNQKITVGEKGNLRLLSFNHCTLTPGQLEKKEGHTKPVSSLQVESGNNNLIISLNYTISGGIDSSSLEAVVTMNDCIVDAVDNSVPAFNCYELKVERSTVFGFVNVVLINASNSIFTEKVTSRRRQVGCMRFCHIPIGSRVPRQYRCQPNYPPDASDSQKTALALKVKPRFTSMKYGEAGYAQLGKDAPEEIFRGADDGNEIGVFNNLKQAARLGNLEASIDEYIRFGLETGVFYVT